MVYTGYALRTRSTDEVPLDTFRENSTVYINEIIAPLNEMKIPFCSTQGVSRMWFVIVELNESVPQNHDNQVNITHLEEIQRELRYAPLSYTRIAPADISGGGKYGPGTYWVPVREISCVLCF